MNRKTAMTGGWISRRARVSLAAMLALAAAGTCPAQDPNAKRLDDLVKHLRQQESLARSAQATLDIVHLPTTAENAALLRAAAVAATGNARFDANRYILNTEYTNRNSRTVGWFRKGAMERLENA